MRAITPYVKTMIFNLHKKLSRNRGSFFLLCPLYSCYPFKKQKEAIPSDKRPNVKVPQIIIPQRGSTGIHLVGEMLIQPSCHLSGSPFHRTFEQAKQFGSLYALNYIHRSFLQGRFKPLLLQPHYASSCSKSGISPKTSSNASYGIFLAKPFSYQDLIVTPAR